MLIRIIGVVILAGLVVVGYIYFTDLHQKRIDESNRTYVNVIAETALAAEMHRLDSEEFFAARDSILRKYGVTAEEMLAVRDQYRGDVVDWDSFWGEVVKVTDSLVAIQDSLRAAAEADSAAVDTVGGDSL